MIDQDLALKEIKIPCISVWQPFADLIFEAPEGLSCGPKDVENRSRPYSYRGPLLIHAGKTRIEKHGEEILAALGQGYPWEEYLNGRKFEYGKIVGVVDLVDCVQGHPGLWANPYWSHNWILKNPRRFGWPIPARGWPGIFYPQGIVERLRVTGNEIGWALPGRQAGMGPREFQEKYLVEPVLSEAG